MVELRRHVPLIFCRHIRREPEGHAKCRSRFARLPYSSYADYKCGVSTDVPVPGDYDGDGKIDVAVYRHPERVDIDTRTVADIEGGWNIEPLRTSGRAAPV